MRTLTSSQKSALTKRTFCPRQTKRVDLKHHRLRCAICRHPFRDQIEQAFLQWRSASAIMSSFDLPAESSLYHHAHAFQLFDRRDLSLRFGLGHIIEDSEPVPVTARDVIRAACALAHLNDDGLWMHPPTKSELVVSAASAPDAPSTMGGSRLRDAKSIASQRKAPIHANH